MGLFDKLFGSSKNVPTWDEIKDTENVYPQNSISLLTLKTESGVFGTGWVDKAYLKYPYKQNCPYNFLIKVDLKDTISETNPDLDYGTIEDFFIDELRKICVSHIIARLATDQCANIEMYIENKEKVSNFLQEASQNPNRQFSFTFEINHDPSWAATKGLMKL